MKFYHLASTLALCCLGACMSNPSSGPDTTAGSTLEKAAGTEGLPDAAKPVADAVIPAATPQSTEPQKVVKDVKPEPAPAPAPRKKKRISKTTIDVAAPASAPSPLDVLNAPPAKPTKPPVAAAKPTPPVKPPVAIKPTPAPKPVPAPKPAPQKPASASGKSLNDMLNGK